MDISKNIEFRFIVPPKELLFDENDENTLPQIDVDVSGLELSLQAILLRVLPLITITSKNGGSNYMFSSGQE